MSTVPVEGRRSHGALSELVAVFAVLATLVAGLIFPGGALIVGLSLAYVVYADDPLRRSRLATLAGVITIVWAAVMISGGGSSVTEHGETSVVVQPSGP